MNQPSNGAIDILGLGAITVDDLIFVESYPPADVKIPVLRSERHCGGLTGTALVTAARLGLRPAYAGLIGLDECSAFVGERMKGENVDMAHVLCRPEASPIHAFIVVDKTNHTRNIFVDVRGISGADAAWPSEELLRSIKLLFVDHIGVRGMLRAAQICLQNRIPIVADFEDSTDPEFSKLLELVDHLILSQGFAMALTGTKSPAAAAAALWGDIREAVVITAGGEGCWYLGKNAPGKICHQPAYQVDAVDTTGCGDVFHGAYAAAVVEKLPLDDRINFASATAALKATRLGGQAGIPSRKTVDEFLKQRGAERKNLAASSKHDRSLPSLA